MFKSNSIIILIYWRNSRHKALIYVIPRSTHKSNQLDKFYHVNMIYITFEHFCRALKLQWATVIHAIIFAKITSENNSFNEPVLVISTSFEYAVISYFLFMSNEKENVNYITSSGCDIFCMLVIVRIWWILVLCIPHSICALESTQEARTRSDRVEWVHPNQNIFTLEVSC